jgi:small subunit ribosomal protein S14
MAKKSKLEKNEQRKVLATRYAGIRRELKAVIKSPTASDEQKDAAYSKLRSLPRDSNPNRIRLRCQFTGRPRGNYRKFGISRIMLRNMALRGEIPGMTKASW